MPIERQMSRTVTEYIECIELRVDSVTVTIAGDGPPRKIVIDLPPESALIEKVTARLLQKFGMPATAENIQAAWAKPKADA